MSDEQIIPLLVKDEKTGAWKADGGKLRVDLIPPDALECAAIVFGYGAAKYGPRNWDKGLSWSRLYGAILRHLFKWWGGEEVDPESGINHLYHALATLLMLVHYQNKERGTDDRP